MAKYEFLRSQLDLMNLEVAALKLVEGCMSDIFQWRIVVEYNGIHNYYMFDFSQDGISFEGDTVCRVSHCESSAERTFSSYFEVLPVLKRMLSKCEIAYVDSF